jgi:hypothetical protein
VVTCGKLLLNAGCPRPALQAEPPNATHRTTNNQQPTRRPLTMALRELSACACSIDRVNMMTRPSRHAASKCSNLHGHGMQFGRTNYCRNGDHHQQNRFLSSTRMQLTDRREKACEAALARLQLNQHTHQHQHY